MLQHSVPTAGFWCEPARYPRIARSDRTPRTPAESVGGRPGLGRLWCRPAHHSLAYSRVHRLVRGAEWMRDSKGNLWKIPVFDEVRECDDSRAALTSDCVSTALLMANTPEDNSWAPPPLDPYPDQFMGNDRGMNVRIPYSRIARMPGSPPLDPPSLPALSTAGVRRSRQPSLAHRLGYSRVLQSIQVRWGDTIAPLQPSALGLVDVGSLRHHLAEEHGLQPAQLRLQCGSRELLDDGESLSAVDTMVRATERGGLLGGAPKQNGKQPLSPSLAPGALDGWRAPQPPALARAPAVLLARAAVNPSALLFQTPGETSYFPRVIYCATPAALGPAAPALRSFSRSAFPTSAQLAPTHLLSQVLPTVRLHSIPASLFSSSDVSVNVVARCRVECRLPRCGQRGGVCKRELAQRVHVLLLELETREAERRLGFRLGRA